MIHEETGFVVDARRDAELAHRIIELLSDEPKRRAMGAAARRHVTARFSASIPPKPLLDWLAEG